MSSDSVLDAVLVYFKTPFDEVDITTLNHVITYLEVPYYNAGVFRKQSQYEKHSIYPQFDLQTSHFLIDKIERRIKSLHVKQ